ncbi:hypothetical protein DVQ84_13125 [Yersinia enterocolitica]|nr:hypothetical protein [Yersinia enterocolitica]QBQ00578.1 hypothetical protein YEY1_18540 [Yersinia enterocolitica subsp. palearctica]EKN4927399.1 hypothetical protein [Yersinia enterocolitica]EKN4931817.1 hypothetical protein [Yersinia enterocolitica]EKN5013668.1 hypothetical protein [Yersinia enterocolitica]
MQSPFLGIPCVLEVAGVLATFVTRPVHGPRLCEAAASSVQIGSRPICYSLAAYLPLQCLWVYNPEPLVEASCWSM